MVEEGGPSSSQASAGVGFRKIKKRPKTLRPKLEEEEKLKKNASKADSEEDEDERIGRHIVDLHEVQQLRKRRNGMTALECALGKKMAGEFDELDDDPFRMKGGGMMSLSEDKRMKLTAEDITSGIKEQFRKEELLFDEDEEMQKYIEANLGEGKHVEDANAAKNARFVSVEDEILLRAAEKMRGFSSKKDDELLSNQMLAGIPEVDLGIEARMKNVLDTEKLKSYMATHDGKPPENDPDRPKKYRRFRID